MCSPDMLSEKPVRQTCTYIISHPFFPINDFVRVSLSPDFLYYLRGCLWIIQMIRHLLLIGLAMNRENIQKCLVTNCRLCSSFGALILQHFDNPSYDIFTVREVTVKMICLNILPIDHHLNPLDLTVYLICTLLLPLVCSHT